MSDDCADCEWMQKLYWGDDFISFVNSAGNTAFGPNSFYTSNLRVLERKSMLMIYSNIGQQDFMFLKSLGEKPTTTVFKCCRRF